jgi:2-desacetyl-2-hydroxyethyl bacteriochlorophyllide A dehydrogenase
MKIQRLVFPDKNRCEVEEVELDENLKDNEVLLKTKISLISAGTELAMFTRAHRGFDEPDFGYAKYPFKPGYLAVSDVVASKSSDAKVGDRFFTSGLHATYSKETYDATRLIRVPAEMNPEHATFFGLARIAMTAPRLSPVRLGGNVVVIGAGIVGNLCAQIYLHSGAGAVAAADLSDRRLRTARECGITHAFNTGAKPLAEWVKEFGPRGAEWIIEAVGNSRTIDAAFKAISFRGNVVLLGSPRTRMEIDPYFDIHRKGIAVIGAHGMHVDAKTQNEDAPLLMDWLRSGKLKVAPLITQHMPMTEGLKGFEGLRDKTDEYLGVILTY